MSRVTSLTARAVLVVGAVVVLLVLGLCAWFGVAATSVTGCQSCHDKTPGFQAATAATAHGKIPCAACHVDSKHVVPRLKFGVYVALGMRLRLLDTRTSDVALISDDRCLACHQVVMSGVRSVGGLRMNHASCSKGRACIDCHSETGHGSATRWSRVPSMNDCVTCHKTNKVTLACNACHIGRVENKPFVGPEFTVTHGPNWRKTHGMGQMSVCSVCHQASKCVGCHGPGVPHTEDIVSEHPAFAKKPGAKCTTCHTQSFCMDCHQLQMPHPKSFAPGHSKLVKAEGDTICMRCHVRADCDGCHVRHVHPGGAVGVIPSPGKTGR